MQNYKYTTFYGNPDMIDINNEDPDLYNEYSEFTEPYPEYLHDGPYTETTIGAIVHYNEVEDPDEIDDPAGYWSYVMGGKDPEESFDE